MSVQKGTDKTILSSVNNSGRRDWRLESEDVEPAGVVPTTNQHQQRQQNQQRGLNSARRNSFDRLSSSVSSLQAARDRRYANGSPSAAHGTPRSRTPRSRMQSPGQQQQSHAPTNPPSIGGVYSERVPGGGHEQRRSGSSSARAMSPRGPRAAPPRGPRDAAVANASDSSRKQQQQQQQRPGGQHSYRGPHTSASAMNSLLGSVDLGKHDTGGLSLPGAPHSATASTRKTSLGGMPGSGGVRSMSGVGRPLGTRMPLADRAGRPASPRPGVEDNGAYGDRGSGAGGAGGGGGAVAAGPPLVPPIPVPSLGSKPGAPSIGHGGASSLASAPSATLTAREESNVVVDVSDREQGLGEAGGGPLRGIGLGFNAARLREADERIHVSASHRPSSVAGSSSDGAASSDEEETPPSPMPPPGNVPRMGKLSLDLSKLKSGDKGGLGLNLGGLAGGNSGSNGVEGLREALKLDLASLTTLDAKANANGEVRPTWEFDLTEITLGTRIGAGAFGEVYEASWRRSRIAVKRLLCQRLTDSARREFMNEMALMSNLRHPHIVRFLGACLEPLQMSILFELCATSLYGVLHVQKQPLQLEYALSLIRQIALGIFYLHQCKEPVLHLDLKSANVLLDEHGVAKVADFGLSKIKKETAVITARMGSPQWTAPEILRGQPHDESADTYSFGVLLYEIMAAKLPYQGVDTFQVVMGVITKMLPRPELPSDCPFPQLMQEMMRACWREIPSERPRFNSILDKADEALEHLALRPQLAGAGARTAAHAIASDFMRSPGPGSHSVNADHNLGATPPGSGHGYTSKQGSSSGSAGALAKLRRMAMGEGLSPSTPTAHGSLLHGGGTGSSSNQQLPSGTHALAAASNGISTARSQVYVAIALVNHVGQAFEELSFKRGDTIRDCEPSSAVPASPASPLAAAFHPAEGGLYRGTLRGRQGYFRGSHVAMSLIGAQQRVEGGAGEGGKPQLQPLELLRELREAEEMLHARDIQVGYSLNTTPSPSATHRSITPDPMAGRRAQGHEEERGAGEAARAQHETHYLPSPRWLEACGRRRACCKGAPR